jgi:hypothetical protein
MDTGLTTRIVPCVIATGRGATDFRVGEAMLKSGLLAPGGFVPSEEDKFSVLLVPADGVSTDDVQVRLVEEVEKATGG